MNEKNEKTSEKKNKVAITIRLDPDFAEAIRNAAWWIGRGLSLNAILEEGGALVLERLQKEHNKGKPFPAREGELLRKPHRTNKGKGRKKSEDQTEP